LSDAAVRAPFYRAVPDRGWPQFSHIDDDLVAFASRFGDPFAGRVDTTAQPLTLLQAAQGLPVYSALGRHDLIALAQSLAITWRMLGVVEGESVLLHDYATSPLVAFASRSFLPHLDRGAADILACTPICNDGLPEFAERCIHILDYAAPGTMFLDGDSVVPVLDALASRRPSVRKVVVSADESLVTSEQLAAWRREFGVEVVQLLRSDAAYFFAPPCPLQAGTYHPSPAFLTEAVTAEDVMRGSPEGRISVTNTAVRSTIVVRYVTSLTGRISTDRCRCGLEGMSVVTT
jgi:phenylacetate-coenzyme A ligase PaaK-like adenylate-forming protein